MFNITGTRSNVTFTNLTFINGGNTVNGSAISVYNYSKITIINCNFTGNFVTNNAGFGGAIYSSYSNISISNSYFIRNNANSTSSYDSYGWGSALYGVRSNITINASSFNNNNGRSGALYGSYCNINVNSSNFTSNNATYGGAAYIDNTTNLTVNNSIFNSNKAASYGGAILNEYNGILNVNNSNFTNNVAPEGGAISGNYNTRLIVNNSNFIGNNASSYGGAISIDVSTTGNISRSNITGNKGGIGGAIYVYSTASLNITGSNIVNNSGTTAGGIYTGGNMVLNYSRLYNNSGYALYRSAGSVTANFNWWGQNNLTGLTSGTITITNYYVMKLYVNGVNVTNETLNNLTINYTSNTAFNLSYNFILNNSAVANTPGNLPSFNVSVSIGSANTGNSVVYNGEARTSSYNWTNIVVTLSNQSANIKVSGDKVNSILEVRALTPSYTMGTYVNSSISTGSFDGSSWNNAVKNISSALDIIKQFNLTQVVIHIAGSNLGGAINYIGVGVNTNLTINNTYNNLTLSGEFGSPVIDAQKLSQIFHISANNVTIANITFINGYTSLDGGAIYNNGTNFSVTNSTFTNNNASYGGAIYNYNYNGGNVSVRSSSFSGNNASYGGAIYNLASVNFSVSNSNFIGNNAIGGGAINNYIYGVNFSVINSTFTGNNANGGGAILNENGVNFSVINSSFTNNNASYDGGAIYNAGVNFIVINSSFIGNNASYEGGAINDGGYDFSVINSSFIGNNASAGGAICHSGVNFSVINSSFIGNNASYEGGAIYNIKGDGFSVINSSFIGNNASAGGVSYNVITYDGGVNFSVINSSFIGNNAGYGGAIYNMCVNFTVSNSSFSNNTHAAIYTLNNQTFIDNNSFEGNDAVLGFGFNDSFINLNSYLLSNNIIINNDIVLLVDGSRNNISNGSIIGNNNSRGIFVNGHNNTFSNITIANLKVGLTFNTTNGGNIISNATFYGNGVGISVLGSNDTVMSSTIVNNTIGINVTGNSSIVQYNRIYNNTLGLNNSGTNLNVNFNWWGLNDVTGKYTNNGADFNLTYWYVLELSLNNTFYTTINATRNYTKNTLATLSYRLTLNNLTTNITNDPSLLPNFTVEVLLRNSTNTVNSSNGDIRTLTFAQVVMLNDTNLQSSINALADNENIVLIIDADPLVNLTIVKEANVTNVLNNDTIQFTITITNNGTDFASNVTFTDLLNNGFKLLNWTGGSYNSTTGIWTVGDIAGKTNVTLQMIVQAIKSGTINNTAGNVTAIEALVDPNINSTVTINVAPAVNLNITKVSNITGFNTSHLGEHVNYTITVKNNGLDTGTNVQVHDILNSKITYFNYTSSVGIYDHNTGLWSIGTLNVNQTATLEIEVIIVSLGTIENVANVTAKETILNGSNTNASTTIHVGPLNSTLVINHIVDAKVNSSVSINGTLLDEKGAPVSGVSINLTVNNVMYNATTNANGNWNITYHVISTGRINVVAEFAGNANYISAANSTYFNGLALNSTLVINPIVDAKVNSSVSINGSLLDEKGAPVSGVSINLTVNNVMYNVITDASGKWSIVYPVGSTGRINVVADFVGDVNHTGAANSTYFNGLALNSTLIINHIVDIKVNSSVGINGSLLDERGAPVSGVSINLTVNNVNYSVTTDASGKWNISYFVGSTGRINVVAEFVGDVNHTGAVNSTYFNGLALNSTLIINPIADAKVNSSVSINGTLLDEKGCSD
ncbi:beta strand repeat-containing protein [Methanobrevibacter filiformis]|uniref:DUF11 domain-containing protein n=1 Tax=Methanobrevibacter filiformis TaxID=55758 RepID=A0A166AJX3_9EURY|nr:DUF11 domain-containing protein [Methanobrevibacter filiformis]KZX12129.1 hypothetical protein MBFIL_12160 [Methanobrevibacter filiformis]